MWVVFKIHHERPKICKMCPTITIILMAVHLPFSFQDLLHGVTSGAVAVPTVQQEILMQESVDVGVQSEYTVVQSENTGETDGLSSSSEGNRRGVSVDDGYIQSCEEDLCEDETKDGTDCDGCGEDDSDEDETSHGTHGSNVDGEEDDSLQKGMITIPSEKDMKLIDWDRFYSTGELVKKTNAVVVENDATGTTNNEIVSTPITTMDPNSLAHQGEQTAWKKRRRVQDGAMRANFRKPSGTGEVERAMRKYCDNKEGHVFEPYVGITFDSEAEAFEFYNLYSWEVGFGVRKGSMERNKGSVTKQ